MGMGIVSEEEFLREIDNVNQVEETRAPVVEIMERPGRSIGDVNVPSSLRKIIGETGAVNGRKEALELADMFGISKSSVSAYTNGSTSTSSYDKPKKSILDVINKSKERITRKAQHKLHSVLDTITPDKLESVNAKDLSSIAKDMSVVIKNMEPSPLKNGEDMDKKPGVAFVLYKPEMHLENHYEVMNLKE